jgi:hypothetical protein
MRYDYDMRESARHTVSFGAGVFALGGSALGLLFFGLMALIAYGYGRYDFLGIGLLGMGAIVAGLFCLLHRPAVHRPRRAARR